MKLNEKLDLWVKITGIKPSEHQKSYTIHFDGRLSNYDIEKMNERIKESLEFDETGIFAEAYLSIYLKQFIENKNIPLIELLENKDLHEFMENVRTLYDSIKEADAEKLIMDEAVKAMRYYNLPCSLKALPIMEIRSSAMKCMNGKLNLLQFSRGNTKANNFKVSKDIYMFDDLDALILCSARGNLNGVTLGYIRNEKNLTESYFAFIIKNGDNLYLLTDMPRYTHPAQRRMTRCPGRSMSNRIEANYFPYETIANIDTSDLWGSSRYGVRETKNELSTKVSEELPYAVIGSIEIMSEEEAFWFIMMADLIKKRFYETELPALDISYTRSMINSPLLNKTENALIVQKSLPSMELGEVTIEDTYNPKYEIEYKEDSDKFNYLIDRYKDEVDNSLLNIISNTEKASLLEDKYAIRDSWGELRGYKYLTLDLNNTAGTKEEIEYKQKWIARYNYAEAISKVVQDDYEKKNNDIYSIIKEFITPRIHELVILHLKELLIGKQTERKGFGEYYTDKNELISHTYEFNKFYDGRIGFGKYRYGFDGYNKSGCKCAFTGKTAGVAIKINPKNAQELALVCGISISELPNELQHYDRKEDKYYGNCILDNIDPFLWVISDPFNKMEFSITILLSKRMYLEFCTEAGVDAVKFWEYEKPVCHNSRMQEKCHGSYRRKWIRDHYENSLSKKCEKCKWYKINAEK